MSNPFKPHALNLFADRGSVDEAMDYARALVLTLPNEHRPAVMTALMVVVNTAAKVWPEAPAQVADEPLAVRLSLVQSDLDGRIAALANRVGDLEQSLNSTARVGWTRDELTELVQSELSTWADDSFNDLADDWLRNHADVGQEVETWMENNFDLENEVRDVLSSANLSITF